MDITAQTIDRILELGKDEQIIHEGRTFHTRKLFEITPPLVANTAVSTLGAIRDYLQKNPDGLDLAKIIVHVAAHDQVDIFSVADPTHRTREHFLRAQVKHKAYPYGSYLDQENFVIAMQTYFDPSKGDTAALLACAGNLADENVAAFGDDGVTQQVQVKAGILRKSEIQVPNPVTLVPYRTFMEIAQPPGKFVFRIQKGRQGPEMAIFEADGGNWKLTAIDDIKTWLEAELPDGTTILA